MSTLEATPSLLQVRPWTDPVLDRTGHDPRDPYCERFWLPLLGPSAVLLTRQLADRLEHEPDGFPLDTDHASRSLGLGAPVGRRSAFNRTMHRLAQFRLLHLDPGDVVLVRRRLPGLSRAQVLRLPPMVRDAHLAWARATSGDPDLPMKRERARALALSLVELGETRQEVEHHLQRLQFHPSVCRESVKWALLRAARRSGPE